MSEELTLSVGSALDGRRLAIISRGGHPQRPNSGTCEVLAVKVVDSWSESEIDTWFKRQEAEQPWSTRQ